MFLAMQATEIALENGHMAAHITGILLTYYPSYFDEAVSRFRAYLEGFPGTRSLVIVHNGPERQPREITDAVLIPGNNACREFSGWETGLAYCRSAGILDISDFVVFANDTFCHHNKFGPISRTAFRRSFQAAMAIRDEPVMVGETFSLGLPFSISGLTSDEWVATYLFGMNRCLLDRISALTPDCSLNNFYLQEDGRLRFSDLVSCNLARHIEHWLSPDNKTHWRGLADDHDWDLRELQGKANAILCEKYLAAHVCECGGTLLNVFNSPRVRFLRKLEAIGPRLDALLHVRGMSS